MEFSIDRELAVLHRMTAAELRSKYRDVFGEDTRSGNKDFLLKRIAWRLQANDEGGLSERARHHALALANDADLRIRPPRQPCPRDPSSPENEPPPRPRDRRLPEPGAVLLRPYDGQTIRVTVLDEGFRYNDTIYRSLSAVARAVTGTHWNGYAFFRIGPRRDK